MNNLFLNPWGRAGLVATIALGLHACAPNQDVPTPTIGVDMGRYVAVGDSYTAGLSAGGLTRSSQEYSFPNLIARQLASVSGTAAFTQPLLESGTGSGYLTLVDLSTAGFPRARQVAGSAVRRTLINPSACGGPDTVRLLTRSPTPLSSLQNLGVPGLLLTQAGTANLGNEATATPGSAFNPYFERLLPAANGQTYLQTVSNAAPSATFFTFFLGLDNLMPYVRSGGQCGATPNSGLSTLMKNNAKLILDRLAGRGLPGIIAQLPNLSTLPLLRLGKGLELQARLQTTSADTARLYIQGPFNSVVGQSVTNEDYVLATAIPRIGKLTSVLVGTTMMSLPYGRDIRNPMVDSDVLDKDEFSRVNGVVDNYNRSRNTTPATGLSLVELANSYRLPIVNTSNEATLRVDDALFFPLSAGGYAVGGVVYTSEPVRGNVFSLDYYSLTPRGNGLLANAFIAAINKAYKANIPVVEVNSLPDTAQ